MTAPATEAATDIAELVDGAFGELECVAPTSGGITHGGETAAYYKQHNCRVGWLCQKHLDVFLDWLRRPHAGRVMCYDCLKVMTDREFATVEVIAK